MPNPTSRKLNWPTIILVIIAIAAGLAIGYFQWHQPDNADIAALDPNANGNHNTNGNANNTNSLSNVNVNGNDNANQNTNTAGNTNTGNATELSDLIQLDSPRANRVINSPISGNGQARGSWFFEASFPVRLEDANGRVIAQTQAQADGDWMTSEFVPFTFSLTAQLTYNQTYWLVLERDNPSGQANTTQALRVPVRSGAGIR
ncbi:MAG: Gmad2 immunoglobulin-like domain-containing protein [Patescibacteria group bacterium]|jgi:hypothetical protein